MWHFARKWLLLKNLFIICYFVIINMIIWSFSINIFYFLRINVFFFKCILTDDVHWITSRQLSPSPATKRNHSPASLSLHNSCSNDSSFFVVDSSLCRLNRLFASENKTNDLLLIYFKRVFLKIIFCEIIILAKQIIEKVNDV